ncbi:tetratricopeptide repeat protein [Desulfomonile tiedjei]|uniref:protein O-GlcNAc transferase n=1 Tax=Desulfomonile tiedjei (strain ATCC 49306 / DSM 6799 / DCB-1) TaxID=706587 RepID=I4C1U5_DESTA|nr:tetratricopeptide repeat protein [Desulfomonile tiedjei]AFM23536.1 putative O-linked N-acetylglucosamine transferase, SPINDLY family [Desulfomonile tiedjei DSM 6799]
MQNLLEKAFDEATSFHRAGDLNRAENIYRSILRRNPRFVAALMNLGALLRQRGRHIDAIGLYKHALTYEPKNASVLSNLGNALNQIGLVDEAVMVLKKAIEIDPNHDLAHDNLGHIYSKRERYDQAKELLEMALKINPDNANALNNIGGVHLAQCRVEESIRCYRKAVELNPHFIMAHSNVLFNMNFSPQYTAEEMAAEHRAWNKQHALPLSGEIVRHPPRDVTKKPLRVGFVSFDFQEHPVGRFLSPLFRARNRQSWEAVCYSDVVAPDRRTDWLRSQSDQWRDTAGLTDPELAQGIQRDRIDILIDLSGHTGHNRLLVFARKPAPVQASWMGYFNTTGLDCMDYLIADRICVPPEHEHLYTEKIVRMPDGFLCYEVPPAPNVGPLPALSRGFVTFCSFNQLAKISDKALETWAEILGQLPRSRLVMRGKALNDATIRDSFAEKLSSLGISRDRMDLLPKTTFHDYLRTYNDVDIALDTFPFAGGTTTCDSLWMGVPVVTFTGDRFCHRHSASHIINSGHEDLVAHDIEGYIHKAIQLASDLDKLSKIRHSMRQKVSQSPLMDAKRFADNFRKCLEQMWTER